MARLSLFNDTVAHLCCEYLHGTLDATINEKIYNAVHEVADQRMASVYVFEIAYRIGYVKSQLADIMSEVTYKKRKKSIRDKIALLERSKNGN